MDETPEARPPALNWFQIWGLVLASPRLSTFARICAEEKAQLGWGVTWLAVAALITWLTSPFTTIFQGLIANNFGVEFFRQSLWIGAVAFPVLAVFRLLLNAALARGTGRLFGGHGAYQQLVYIWGVIQVPFAALAALVSRLPALFPMQPGYVMTPQYRIVMFGTLALMAGVGLYQAYAGVTAYAAVEKMTWWKGLAVLLVLNVFLSLAGYLILLGVNSAMGWRGLF